MNIIIKHENDITTVIVEGKIDSTTAPELESTLKGELSRCSKLIFDFKNLDYISSAGLRVLLGTQKFMGSQGMKIVNVNETVNDIFEITGFSFIFNIERS